MNRREPLNNYSTWNSDPLTRVLSRLKTVKPNGKGYIGCCPAHDDHSPSLSISLGTDGRVLLHCYAGCPIDDILLALNLKHADLFPREDFQQQRGKPTATYRYYDVNRNLLYEVLRFYPKTFRQRRPDGQDGWIYNMKGVTRVLYSLPELIRADVKGPVFITEGEKDVESLIALGLVATCNVGGAGKWNEDYSKVLQGRDCIILPDNDKPGKDHAEFVASMLADYAHSIKIVELPGLPPGGDVTDWIKAGGTADALRTISDNTPFADISSFASFTNNKKRENEKRGGLHLTTLPDLLNEPEQEISYLVDGLLPSGGISMLSAKPKVGKSTTIRELSLCVARGEPFLGHETKQGKVIYLALEEKRSGVADHFRNMGGGEDAILVHFGAVGRDIIDELEAAIREQNAVLAIVDPLLRFIRVSDVNDYAQVTGAMEPLVELARNTGCHVLCLHHLGKADRFDGDASDGILGSTALFASVDTSMIMRKRGDSRTLESTQRYGPDMPPTVLIMDAQTGHITAAGDFEAIQLDEIGAEILALLKSGSLQEKEIRERIGGNSGTCGRALRKLLDDDKAMRSGMGRKNDPYIYSLASAEEVAA